jgi:hypothetical protein
MLKKKQVKPREGGKINHLFKNFKGVESYINIMDIINNLPIEQRIELEGHDDPVKETMP